MSALAELLSQGETSVRWRTPVPPSPIPPEFTIANVETRDGMLWHAEVWVLGEAVGTPYIDRTQRPVPADLVAPTLRLAGFDQLDTAEWHREKLIEPAGESAGSRVYVIEGVGTGLAKIGRAYHPAGRCEVLQCGSPVRLALRWSAPETDSLNERTLHRHFSGRRAHGEWFAVSAAEVEAFAGCPE